MTDTIRETPAAQTPAGAAPLPLAGAATPETLPAARAQQSAALAAAGVGGVHAVGSPAGRTLVRAMGRVRGGRTSYGSGVSVEVGAEQAAVDVSLVLEYGAQAPQVGDQVRTAVGRDVAAATGLEVLEVNVTVVDVHHPDDDVPPPAAPEPLVDEPEAEAEAGPLPEEPAAAAVEDADEAPAVDAATADSATLDETPATTVVVGPADGDGGTPRVVVAEQVVVADEVVVVDGDGAAEDRRPA
ncbi:Asp23/Gls24 family envelope stress response protein [Microlunatus capsulatus]|uniref:Alkaline shock family protein YloU n=1 Tax=Microlunatus capsulatus TaxID=99117 RepID=A0ABS4Z9B1_9ACTN|nr:Asp23/Gls24 family envelope stress response protein [Microlunatus capsulatus]MBP2417641.1 putative alkaline shock family protein YloU [Microlunatus capsulatus]